MLDDNANKRIIDIIPDIFGRSIATDPNRDMLYIGDEVGNVTAMGLSDSDYVSDFPEEINSSISDPILALATDIFGVLWGASECSIHYLMPAKGSLWKSLDFCSTFQEETPLELYIDGRNLFLATEDHGIRVIEYNLSLIHI